MREYIHGIRIPATGGARCLMHHHASSPHVRVDESYTVHAWSRRGGCGVRDGAPLGELVFIMYFYSNFRRIWSVYKTLSLALGKIPWRARLRAGASSVAICSLGYVACCWRRLSNTFDAILCAKTRWIVRHRPSQP
jgi:hypothetical protein